MQRRALGVLPEGVGHQPSGGTPSVGRDQGIITKQPEGAWTHEITDEALK